MSRDWNAEEALLVDQAKSAFGLMMGLRTLANNAPTEAAAAVTRYVAVDAREAYEKAREDLKAFIAARRASEGPESV